MAERRIHYPILWLVFIASLLVAAGLLLSPDAGRQAWGFFFLFAPLGFFAMLMGLFYWRSRRIAETDE